MSNKNLGQKDYENLFNILFNYCDEKNLKLIYREAGPNMSRYLTIAHDGKINPGYQRVYKSFELERCMINNDFFSTYDFTGLLPFFRLECQSSLELNKVFSELTVECLWSTNKRLTEKFLLYLGGWCGFNEFAYHEAIQYKNKNYPDGFADNNITPYSKEKNIHHLIDITDDMFNFYPPLA